MGGMSAQIPIKNDPAANERAMSKVRADKLREVTAGHDGTWVAHPALIPIALVIFNQHMPGPNQYHVRREDVTVTDKQIADPSVPGKITEQGLRDNVSAALSYCAAWISGNGCVPINHLMEDAATAEIARVQLWQWCKYGSKTVSLPSSFPHLPLCLFYSSTFPFCFLAGLRQRHQSLLRPNHPL